MTTTDFNRDYKAFCKTEVYNAPSSTMNVTECPLTGSKLFALDERLNTIVSAWHKGELHTLPLRCLAILRSQVARPSYDVLLIRIMTMDGNLSYTRHSITIYSK